MISKNSEGLVVKSLFLLMKYFVVCGSYIASLHESILF